MAYEFPTVENFRARFPEFSETEDPMVTLLLEEAGRAVDTNWTEGDYAIAIMYLAAHLASQVQQAGSSGGSGEVQQRMRTIRFADRMVSFDVSGSRTVNSQAMATTLGQTSYGLIFGDLLRRNVASVVVV